MKVPFENWHSAFAAACEEKISKYAGVAEALRPKGYHAFVDAIIVGSLGASDSANDDILPNLQWYGLDAAPDML